MANNELLMDSEYMDFFDESTDDMALEDKGKKWKIMIIDDDHEVHTITKLVLSDFAFNNVAIEFIDAYSAKEARELLKQTTDLAIILLDVVMEEEDSGLKLVQFIREEIKNHEVRIILRTGQPGQAPEKRVIVDYDINDYKEKTELTAQKLFTTIVASLRAYESIHLTNLNKKGLEKVIEASSYLFEVQSISKLSAIVLEQINSMLCFYKNIPLKEQCSFVAFKKSDGYYITAASGNYTMYLNMDIKGVIPPSIHSAIIEGIRDKRIFTIDTNIVLHFKSITELEYILYFEGANDFKEMDKSLLEIFSHNISNAFENAALNLKLQDTQKEIIYTLGEIAEARSKETGNHVKRVSEFSRLLALKCGMSDSDAETISLASAMHDIGKLGVPASILNKPGKLTVEEFEVIKTHTTIGYEMLKNSTKEIIRTASIIAYQHHEKYNGKGYPNGLKGEAIHLYGRITAIADVFDALGTIRVYKPAWNLEKILDYFRSQRGEHFDPYLVDLFFENIDEFVAIRNSFKDHV
ncbi:MAG TPA: HD domain-containing phosphohydrolase [Pseudobacteroides sp.]|uniref:HD domain-containing phosphohydrolase n=1 Tax=Pseudobacteroides sp. TaxID=1968840 RepID=UPI002F94985B